MKLSARTHYYTRFGDSTVVNVLDIKYPESRTDQTFYRSVKDLVADFIATGKALADVRKARYDFENGKDDGTPLSLDRNYQGVELPDMSQAISDLHNEVSGREESLDSKLDRVVDKVMAKANAKADVKATADSSADSDKESD